MDEIIEDKILNKAKKCGRGSVFFVTDRLALLLTTALKDWKVENLTPEQVFVIKTKLNDSPRFQDADFKMMTASIREFIMSLYDQK